jgi:hypothetical protein
MLLALLLQAAQPIPEMDWLRENLRDFDSAKVEPFAQYTIGTWKKQIATFQCYRVNAKNAYGGFTGWKTYLFVKNVSAIIEVRTSPYLNPYSGRETDSREVLEHCPGVAPLP